MAHAATICPRDVATNQYNGKNWSAQFKCPACGRATRQNLNFLGRRSVVCDGVKFTKVNGAREAGLEVR